MPRGYVSRPRLAAVLDVESALVVVHGPAGSGKTVVVADWASASASEVPGVWLTIGRNSSKRVAFWLALAEMLMDAGIAPKESILGSGGLTSLESQEDPRQYIIRAFAQLPGELRIVFDDFRHLADPSIEEDLLALLQANPRLTVVVITRALGEFDSVATRLALDPIMLGPDELRLTQQEVAEVVASSGVTDADGNIARDLERAVEGNALLTRAVAQAIGRSEVAFGATSFQRTVTELGSHLLRELVLSGFTAEERRAALFCSVPAVLTAELVRELTGDDGTSLLMRFEAEGFGIWSAGDREPTLSLSPLVRTALRTELDEHFPGEVARLSQVTALWCSRHDQPVTALDHAIDGGDLGLATDVVFRHAIALFYVHPGDLIALLDPLPIRKLSQNPILAIALAIALNTSGAHKPRAFELFAVAVLAARLRRNKEPPGRRAIMLLIESSALRVIGRGGSAAATAERARALVEELSQDDRDALGALLPLLLNQAGITFFYGGRPETALRLFEEALSRTSDVRQRETFHALCLTAGVHAIEGRMVDAARIVERLRSDKDWPIDFVNGYWGALLHIAEAHAALERLDFDAARAHVAVMEPHLATIEHWPLFAHIEAIAHLGKGEAHAALAGLEAEVSRSSSVTTSFARESIDCTRALLHLALGRSAPAERILSQRRNRSVLVVLGLARLELLRGRPEQTISALLAVEGWADAAVRWRAEALLLRAAAALRLDRIESALAAVDDAAALMTENGLRTPLLMLPLRDVEALSAALDERGDSLAGRLLRDDIGHPRFVPDFAVRANLSTRELVVLGALASTDSVAVIAEELFVSRNTVKTQLRSIYRKLEVSSREEALLIASELQLIP